MVIFLFTMDSSQVSANAPVSKTQLGWVHLKKKTEMEFTSLGHAPGVGFCADVSSLNLEKEKTHLETRYCISIFAC